MTVNTDPAIQEQVDMTRLQKAPKTGFILYPTMGPTSPAAFIFCSVMISLALGSFQSILFCLSQPSKPSARFSSLAAH